ncbi:hypothetical protein CRYUN_Cryun05aG0244100 [Craigia yunnanensis]
MGQLHMCLLLAPSAKLLTLIHRRHLKTASMAYPCSINIIAPGYAPWDEASMLVNTASSKFMPPQDEFTSLRVAEADIGSKGVARISNSGLNAIGSSSRTIPSSDMPKQGKQAPMLHGIPDFAEVYSFIGSVFDPDTKGHVHKLKEMDPINFETVLLLMRNLTVNLCSPDFEPIGKVLSSYDVSTNTMGVTAGIIPQNQMNDVLLC